MDVYGRLARVYDAFAAEPVYRPGRTTAVRALGLRGGDRVLDVGCGTGLSLPLLLDAVGPSGQVIGVDGSAEMLEVAARRASDLGAENVVLVEADATALDAAAPSAALSAALSAARADPAAPGVDALLCAYSLSVVPDWRAAWEASVALLRLGGRAAVVDMQPPTGWARVASPLARLACRVGGSDITARPWTALEEQLVDVRCWSRRGGHVQVRVGTKPPAHASNPDKEHA